jgi:hypothetical protein
MKEIKLLFIQLADTLLRKRYKDIEHRKFIRLKDYISLGVRLFDYESGKPCSRQISGKTLNISKQGLCIETSTVTVDGVDVFNNAMSDEQGLEIEIDDYQSSEKLKALGKVIWFDMTPKQKSFLFKAGVYITIKNTQDMNRWYSLVENAKKANKGKSWFMRGIKNIIHKPG